MQEEKPRPWYEIGTVWLRKRAELDHGDIIRATAAFARDEKVAPNTLRRYLSAAVFLGQLRQRGEIDDAQLAKLAGQKIKCVGVLQRVAHYGRERMVSVLELMLENEAPTRKALETVEAQIRDDEAGAAGQALLDPTANAHSFRMQMATFRRAAIEAWGNEAAAVALDVMPPCPAGRTIIPLTLHALAAGPGGIHALRVVAETSSESRAQSGPEGSFEARLGELFVEALAAARVFTTVTLLAQSREDAETLADAVRRLEGPGLRVAVLGRAGSIETLATASRGSVPDLASMASRFTAPQQRVENSVPGARQRRNGANQASAHARRRAVTPKSED